jgi:hypothetical protein
MHGAHHGSSRSLARSSLEALEHIWGRRRVIVKQPQQLILLRRKVFEDAPHAVRKSTDRRTVYVCVESLRDLRGVVVAKDQKVKEVWLD